MITLAMLIALKEDHRIEFRAESSCFVTGATWMPAIQIERAQDDERLAPLLAALEAIGARWPTGRILVVEDGQPIGYVGGEIEVLPGGAPWRLCVSVHHRRTPGRRVHRFEV